MSIYKGLGWFFYIGIFILSLSINYFRAKTGYYHHIFKRS